MSSAIAFRFLTASRVSRLHIRQIIKSTPTQPGMLDSAINSPINHKHYGQTDVFQLAGVLAEKIILDHPYQDGNKRTALYAADTFLKMNGYRLQTKPMGKSDAELDDELANAHVFVATRKWSAEDLGKYYRSIAEPLSSFENAEAREACGDAVLG